jgi:hypothetical protein
LWGHLPVAFSPPASCLPQTRQPNAPLCRASTF